MHITELTGITKEDVEHALAVQEVLSQFFRYVQSTVLIGYYIGHDTQFLNYYLWKYYRTRLKHRVLELKNVVNIVLPQVGELSFDDACQLFEVTNKARHTAIGDASAVAELWGKLVSQLDAVGIQTLQHLYEELAARRHHTK